jgi:outer membrane protein TolC
VELTQARNALNQARSSYEQARYDRRLAGFRLANEMEEVP